MDYFRTLVLCPVMPLLKVKILKVNSLNKSYKCFGKVYSDFKPCKSIS